MLRFALPALLALLLGPAAAQPAPAPLRQAVHEAASAAGTPTEAADALVYAASSVLDEEQKLTASDAGQGDFFGYSVALDGDRALIGAENADTDDGLNAGAAYVFVRSGDTWTEEARLTPSDADAGDRFGTSVALDGDRALIGALWDDALTGSAYVFVRSGATWIEETKLIPSDFDPDDDPFFGSSVSLDDDRALVGASEEDGDGGTNAGAAYVFVRSGSNWIEEQKLTASDAAVGDSFGSSVSLDGDRALISAIGDDRGSAYVFVSSGGTWIEEQELTANDDAAEFGRSVSLDGDRALIGANAFRAAYVFTRSGDAWTQEQKLTASDDAVLSYFGWSVSLSGDRALIGAYGTVVSGESFAGAAYVFVRSGDVWTEEQKLTASDADGGDYLGWSVSLDGAYALAGAHYHDTSAGENAGAAYVFSGIPVATEDSPEAKALRLDAPFPNPSWGASTVRYALDAPAEVRLALYDVLGREVAVLVAGPRAAGPHEAHLAASHLPAGTYVLRLTAGSAQATRKVLLVR